MKAIINRFKPVLLANWGFIGVVVFFIVHGYKENEHVVPVTALMVLLAKLLLAATGLFLLSRLLLRSWRKANLFTAFAGMVVLFFGVFQDFLKQFSFLTVVARFRVFFPLSLLLIVVAFFLIKRTTRSLARFVLFLQTLILLYVLIDAGILIKHSAFPSTTFNAKLAGGRLSVCAGCQKPSVYLVLLDAYSGETALKEYFNYDNSRFEHFLSGQEFHVVQNSRSNYMYTVFSMASMLNMQYLQNIGTPEIANRYGFNTATSQLMHNLVCTYFSNQGYTINNLSMFDLAGTPPGYSSGVLPQKIQLLNTQTMYYQAMKFLPGFLVRSKVTIVAQDHYTNSFIVNNENTFKDGLRIARQKKGTPAFTYLHVLMPHFPFVLDSNGNKTDFWLKKDMLPQDSLDSRYLQYEIFTNKRVAQFITELKEATAGKAVILLMSDHGYQDAFKKNEKIPFYNLNAVYLPAGNYAAWYDGMSNVNQFRVLFNTLFHQNLQLMPDSIVTK